MVEADLSSPRGAADAPREADHPHDFADRPFRGRQAAQARCRRRAQPVPDRLQDLRHAQCRSLQCGAGVPRAHRRPARGELASGHQEVRLVGNFGRPRQADRYRALFRDLPERGRRLHGHDRDLLRPIRKPASRGAWNFPSSPSATWCGRRPCCSIISASSSCSRSPAARWAACRCCNGRRAIRSACSRRCRSPAPPAIRRRTSRSTRSAGRRSWPIRNGAAAAITWKAPIRAAGSRSRAWARISRICPTPRCTGNSAASSRIAKIRPSRSMRISRWNPICATRASRSSSASMPIRISISRAPWIISTWPPTPAACWPMLSRRRRRASA